ncbi:MAG TPA: ABC transporter permease, partial [Verrucomicrobiae bacterium]|nr:ABC transporter permease [Verrucomicrobiae bacterium]
QESRLLEDDFTASGRFSIAAVAQNQMDVTRAIDDSTATIAITIQPGFAELLRKGATAPIEVAVDGTNSNTALIALGYVGQVASNFSQDYSTDFLSRTAGGLSLRRASVTVEERPWYNEDTNSRWFFVPGVIGTLTLTLIVNLTAFAIVREREVGTLEQIMVTPIRPIEFILGKTLPFFLIGLGEVALVMGVGLFWFQVPFTGSPLVMLLGTCLFLLSTLALGLLISTICTTQQQAFATNFFVVNPLFTLSGFSFPIASMPLALQWFSYINPLRYFLVLIRACFLKGVGFTILWPELLALALLGVLLLSASILRFRKSLD